MMDLQTMPDYQSNNHNLFDLYNLPHFDCLCELCDCG